MVFDVGRFTSQTTGNVYLVIKDRREIWHRPVSGPATRAFGASSYRTSCGIELNAASADESRFTTLDGEVLVRSD